MIEPLGKTVRRWGTSDKSEYYVFNMMSDPVRMPISFPRALPACSIKHLAERQNTCGYRHRCVRCLHIAPVTSGFI